MALVTVPEVEPFKEYTVGGTPQSTFTIPSTWAFFDQATDIRAFKDGTELTYAASPSGATQFSVTGIEQENGYLGGQIDLGATVTDCVITLQRDVPIDRTENFPTNTNTLNIKALNTALSRVAAWAQQFALKFNRAIRLADGDSDATLTLPVAASRASKYLGFDASGNVVATEGASDATPISSFMANVVAAGSAAAARALLGAGTLSDINDDTTPQLGGALDTNGKAINESEGEEVASAATPNIWAADGNTVHITGTTTITNFADAPRIGATRKLIFDGALTLTHGSGITLPGSVNITTAAGDSCYVYADAVDAFRVLWYSKANGRAISETGYQTVQEDTTSSTAALAWTLEAGYDYRIVGRCRPVSDSVDLNLLLGVSGPTYRTANYSHLAGGVNSGGTVSQDAIATAIQINTVTQGNATDEDITFTLEIFDPAAATDTHFLGLCVFKNTSGTLVAAVVGGHHETAEAMVAAQLSYSSGNFADGSIVRLERKAST